MDRSTDQDENSNPRSEEGAEVDSTADVSNNHAHPDEPNLTLGARIFSSTCFSSLEGSVSALTLNAIKEMGFTKMTKIQVKSIPYLLEGKDLLGHAKTGSGRTLAFLISAIELAYKQKLMPKNGTGVIIISPRREKSMQTFDALRELSKHHCHSNGIVMGGIMDLTNEAAELVKGVNILIATPDGLLAHLNNTADFVFKNLQCLIIDEANHILDLGFEEELKQIIRILPSNRQTIIFSATSTRKIDDLARLALKDPIKVGSGRAVEEVMAEVLSNGFIACPIEERFLLLVTFLKRYRKRKVMVFYSSCLSVKFHYKLLNYINFPVMRIQGNHSEEARQDIFAQFCNAESGILLCSEIALQGLDIPAIDWIVQYDPPDDIEVFVHRVDRTVLREDAKGYALLLLRPEELGYLQHLMAKSRTSWIQFEFFWNKIIDIQPQLEKLIAKNYFLHTWAKQAYKAYLHAYYSHHLKTVFDVNTLDLGKVAQSFGFRVPPSFEFDQA